MFNIGGGELLVIALIALIVLGPQRLPDAARTVGRVMGEVRKLSSGFQREVREAFEDADSTRPARDQRTRESRPLAATIEEADRGAAGTVGAEPTAATGEVGEVAPAVGDALDDITATGAGESDEPWLGELPHEARPDDPGGHRAAS